MHSRFIAALIFGVALATAVPAQALQCVPFAREISGISLRGDAWTWWSGAVGTYDRGQAPRVGAVVVFKKHGSMRRGHVAVVTDVVNSREVLVDHANWGSRRTGGRGQIAKGMSVVDISSHNDWSQVRVWNRRSGDYGTRVYPTYGFIYAQGSRPARYQQVAFVAEPPHGVQAPVISPSLAQNAAVSAPLPRLSQPGDPVLATADQQIAAALSEASRLPVAVDVKSLDLKPVEAKSVETKQLAAIKLPAKAELHQPTAQPLPEEQATAPSDDQALARRFGSGRY